MFMYITYETTCINRLHFRERYLKAVKMNIYTYIFKNGLNTERSMNLIQAFSFERHQPSVFLLFMKIRIRCTYWMRKKDGLCTHIMFNIWVQYWVSGYCCQYADYYSLLFDTSMNPLEIAGKIVYFCATWHRDSFRSQFDQTPITLHFIRILSTTFILRDYSSDGWSQLILESCLEWHLNGDNWLKSIQ